MVSFLKNGCYNFVTDKIAPTTLVFTIFYDLLFMIFEEEGQLKTIKKVLK